MTELTEQSSTSSTSNTQMTGAQRLSYEVALILAKSSLGQYRTPEQHQFDIVCKLNDYFQMVIPGFDSDKFFIKAGYSHSTQWVKKQ